MNDIHPTSWDPTTRDPTAWRPPVVAGDLRRDGLADGVLGRRVVAFLIDGLLCSIALAVLWTLLFTFGVLTLGLGLPLLGVLPAVPFFYNWLFVASSLSATPGQRAMGLVVRRDADLGPPTPVEALIWTAGFVVTVSLGAIWFAAALVTVRHRALHDIVSGLVVARREALTAMPAPVNAAPDRPEYV